MKERAIHSSGVLRVLLILPLLLHLLTAIGCSSTPKMDGSGSSLEGSSQLDASVDGGLDCPPWTPPPGLGGPVDANVSLLMAERWKAYRSAREEERMWEAFDPETIQARYRIEQTWIENECVSSEELIDLGRGLFLRNFTLEEGLGNALAGRPGTPAGVRPPPNLRRFQNSTFGGPEATRCASCHWKGGFAGGGDRADNAFFRGDGNFESTHDERNPIALWGAGWLELLAREMTAELQDQASQLAAEVRESGAVRSRSLVAKGVAFGQLAAAPGGDPTEHDPPVFDYSGVVGVDSDLIVKPFGWKGAFATIREIVNASFHLHMGLQPEEVVGRRIEHAHLLLGDESTDLKARETDDPDADGVTRELTEGQVTAMVAFLATLDTPVVSVPTEAGIHPDLLSPLMEPADGQEFTARWIRGQAQFEAIGCASCHVPFLSLADALFETSAPLSDISIRLDLSDTAAQPRPASRPDGSYVVPIFSDLKRHDMGENMAARTDEMGMAPRDYLTRPLWGLANSGPYMHDGSAVTFDDAIDLHGAEGSEAKPSAEAFHALTESGKADLRVFLQSMRRGPAIRVR